MNGLRIIGVRLWSFFHYRRLDRELDEEIRFHLEALEQENIRRGMDPAIACTDARRQFGGVNQAMESYREQRGLPLIEETFKDIRYAFRVMLRAPTATIVAIIALALGIGANSCIFTSVNAIIRKPLAFEELDRLVRIWDSDPKNDRLYNMVSAADFLDWKAQCKTLEHISAFNYWAVNMTGVDDPERLQGYAVSASFFTALGMQPLLGRTFSPSEEEPGKDDTVILSHGLWQRRFASDPQVLGKKLLLNGHSYAVAGVMPQQFDYPVGTDLWLPLALSAGSRSDREGRYLFVLARLRDDSRLEQAEAEMNTIAGRLSLQFPRTNEGHSAKVQRLRDVLNTVTDRFLVLLMAAAGFVLLLACANVANIQLARIASREREMALRSTLGAHPWRITRQLLAENLLLALLGGICGLLLAVWGVNAMKAAIPAQVYKWVAGLRQLKIDADVLGFTLAIALLTGIFCALAPAWHAYRLRDLSGSLKDGGRNIDPSGSRRPLRHVLVITEVALAVVLLVAASLMVKAFQRMMNFNLGFNPHNLLTMRISLPPARYGEPALCRDFYEQALERLQVLPEVEAVGAANNRSSVAMADFRVEGQPARPTGEALPDMQFIDGNYFAAMGIPLRRGRLLTAQEKGSKQAAVAIISESVARRFWKNADDAIGSAMHVGGYGFPPITVIGVVGDVKDWFTGQSEETIYLSNSYMPQWSMEFMLRTRIDPQKVVANARAQVHSVDRNQPIYDIKSMEQTLDEQTSGVRLAAVMMAAFALIALCLAVSGVYGIVSYSVAQRTQEIGVRLALGASSGNVLALVVGQALRLATAGLAIGLIVAYIGARLMSSMLYGVIDPDIVTFAGLSALLLTSAMLAGYLPARRAVRIDPLMALRCE